MNPSAHSRLLRTLAREGIDQRVLAAMALVPRHEFVLEEDQEEAYQDTAMPIGHGQTISQPYIVGLMTEKLELLPTDRVLEIGTGSGYQTAVLSGLAGEVFSVEIVETLGLQARERLERLGFSNIHLRISDGSSGWPEASPFDAIIVTCAPKHVPEKLVEQLKEGGRMMLPVGMRHSPQELRLLHKHRGQVRTTGVLPVRFVPMTGAVYEEEVE